MKRLTKTISYANGTKICAFQTFEAHHFRILLNISPINLSHPVLPKPQGPQIHPESFGSLEVGSITPPRVVGPIPGEWMSTRVDWFINFQPYTIQNQLFPEILKKGSYSTHFSCHGLKFLLETFPPKELSGIDSESLRSQFQKNIHGPVGSC